MTLVPFLLALTVQASMTLHLAAAPEAAFPLFDPVNESRWDPGWNPQLLGTRVQQGLVFLTDDDRGRSTWLLDVYDPQKYVIRYVVNSPSILDQIDIALQSAGPNRTIATVTYTRTALDPKMEDSVRHFGEHFPSHAAHWESAINSVLTAR